jgi:outer membrane lipoprotein-sorting protein
MSPGRSGAPVRLAFAAMMAVCAAQLAAQGTPADSSFDALYKRGVELNAQLKTLTAHFTETTTSTMLTRPLVAAGTVAVERPSRVILHYLEPEQRDVLIEGDRMTVSWPARHIHETTNIATANRRIQKYFVDASPASLRDNFTITTRTGGERARSYQLTMVPKRKQMKEGLSVLDLWLDESSLLLSAMKMTFPNGDTKLMVLDKVVVNQPIDPSVFSAAK